MCIKGQFFERSSKTSLSRLHNETVNMIAVKKSIFERTVTHMLTCVNHSFTEPKQNVDCTERYEDESLILGIYHVLSWWPFGRALRNKAIVHFLRLLFLGRGDDSVATWHNWHWHCQEKIHHGSMESISFLWSSFEANPANLCRVLHAPWSHAHTDSRQHVADLPAEGLLQDNCFSPVQGLPKWATQGGWQAMPWPTTVLTPASQNQGVWGIDQERQMLRNCAVVKESVHFLWEHLQDHPQGSWNEETCLQASSSCLDTHPEETEDPVLCGLSGLLSQWNKLWS